MSTIASTGTPALRTFTWPKLRAILQAAFSWLGADGASSHHTEDVSQTAGATSSGSGHTGAPALDDPQAEALPAAPQHLARFLLPDRQGLVVASATRETDAANSRRHEPIDFRAMVGIGRGTEGVLDVVRIDAGWAGTRNAAYLEITTTGEAPRDRGAQRLADAVLEATPWLGAVTVGFAPEDERTARA